MDFNGSSPVSEVLQISHSVRRDAEGNLEVSLGRFNPREDVKKAAGYPPRASRYRIRLMAVAFDFRQEYLEYLDIKDLDVHRTAVMEAQTITLNTQADPSCIVMLLEKKTNTEKQVKEVQKSVKAPESIALRKRISFA